MFLPLATARRVVEGVMTPDGEEAHANMTAHPSTFASAS
jgi:hypothetical protein